MHAAIRYPARQAPLTLAGDRRIKTGGLFSYIVLVVMGVIVSRKRTGLRIAGEYVMQHGHWQGPYVAALDEFRRGGGRRCLIGVRRRVLALGRA
jgi:hypothetical protein